MPIIEWGLLWYDDQGTIEDRVRRAAERHKEKYGTVPNICFANRGDIEQEELVVDDCHVYRDSHTLKNHVWIGVYNETQRQR